uniref:MAT1-2-1 n=1 Tax=Neofusicoccum luteum TaxID=120395 RepID=A0A343K014_9PEZI|nr:MAT1-2-1 [Neofusicoccum luteum]
MSASTANNATNMNAAAMAAPPPQHSANPPNLTPVQRNIATAWSGILQQIHAGATQIRLPMGIHLAIGWGGLQVLVNSISLYLNTQVIVLNDHTNNVYRLVFSSTFHANGVNSTVSTQPDMNQQQHAAGATQPTVNHQHNAVNATQPTIGQQQLAVRDPQPPQVARPPLTLAVKARERRSMVPRPMNCFILYRKEKHPSVVAANPGVHNNEISKIIGRMWRAETRATKEIYKAKAEKLSQEHAAAHPEYRYAPRRSAVIRRRQRGEPVRVHATHAALLSSTQVSNAAGSAAGSSLGFVAPDVIKQRLRASEQSSNELRINSDDFNTADYPDNEVGTDRPHINMGVSSMADQIAYAGVLDDHELSRQARENFAMENRLGGSLSAFLGSFASSEDVFDFSSPMGCSYDRLTAATQRNAELVAEGALQSFNNFTFPDDGVNFDFTSLDGQDTNSAAH